MLYGTSKILDKKGLSDSKLLTSVLFNLFISIPILLVYTVWNGELSASHFTALGVVEALFAGILQFALGILFLYASMKRVGAARASIMGGTQVVFAPVLSILFFRERITLPLVLGTLIIFGGLALVSSSSPSPIRQKTVPKRTLQLGYIYGVLAGFFWGASYPFSRVSTLDLGSAGTSSLFAYGFAVLAIFVILLLSRQEKKFEIPNRSKVYLSGSGALNVFGTLVRSTALSLAPVVLVTPFASLSPLPAVLLSYLIIQKVELINRKVIAGAIAVVSGAVIIAALA